MKSKTIYLRCSVRNNIYEDKCQRHDYAISNLTLGSVTGAVCGSRSHTHTHNYCSSREMTSSHELTTRHK